VSTDASQTLTNKTINASSNTITNVSLTTAVTGTLPIANGGTGQTTANAALNALLPSQTGNNGKALTTDGTSTAFTALFAGGLTQIEVVAALPGSPNATTLYIVTP
jgi:molybdopterin biosynthesis enzyme MoaB